jgi:hypothetical protein
MNITVSYTLNACRTLCNFTALCEMKYYVGCIARCEMQALMRHIDRGITVEFVTLFTQTICHVTPSKYTNNCHNTCKLYDYCPVCANNAL